MTALAIFVIVFLWLIYRRVKMMGGPCCGPAWSFVRDDRYYCGRCGEYLGPAGDYRDP